jgi:hypothetical protein
MTGDLVEDLGEGFERTRRRRLLDRLAEHGQPAHRRSAAVRIRPKYITTLLVAGAAAAAIAAAPTAVAAPASAQPAGIVTAPMGHGGGHGGWGGGDYGGWQWRLPCW